MHYFNNIEKVPTYIINLKSRVERKENVLKEFQGKNEFDITVVEAIRHEIGAIGLWETIKHILQDLVNKQDEFIILCEDDHEFTKSYSEQLLFNSIVEAQKMDADILCGGISWFQSAFKISENLFWTEAFSGTQFVVLFRKFFSKIINSIFTNLDSADFKMCSLTDKKIFLYPFISVQKDYGYSDATPKNNKEGCVKDFFDKTAERLQILESVFHFYESKIQPQKVAVINSTDNITIPTYVINFPKQFKNKKRIEEQFKNKPEFDVINIDAIKTEVNISSLWMTLRKIIQLAIENDDDVIIICENNHEFTSDYSKDYLISNIITGSLLGCDYMHGGTLNFDMAIPITRNIFWTNLCLSVQFIIIYRNFFRKILDEPFDETIIPDLKLSEMATNKLILYPYISTQKGLEKTNIVSANNEQKNLIASMFNLSKKRLEIIQQSYVEFGKKSL